MHCYMPDWTLLKPKTYTHLMANLDFPPVKDNNLSGMNLFFQNRLALLATKHGKEMAIAPILGQETGLLVKTAAGINTDIFGTFSGEIPREGTPLETARKKIEKAFELYPEADITLASEGSFFPHPEVPFITLNQELILLVDRARGIEITGQSSSTQTNMARATVKTLEELEEFAERIGFPFHGIILKYKPRLSPVPVIWKDIMDKVQLRGMGWLALRNADKGEVEAETDMRALYNPTRLQNIQAAAVALAQNMNSFCPGCGMPGFVVTNALPGLPCSQCHLPTKAIKAHVYTCAHCSFSRQQNFPSGKRFQDAMFCDNCNP